MDIQAEKLRLIEQLARLQDVTIIQKVKEILQSSYPEISGYNPDGSVISRSDLVSRAEDSNKAIKEGKTKSIQQVRENLTKW